MESYEKVIVGSGPAGVAAATQLDFPGTCIVDVGLKAVNGTYDSKSFDDALLEGNINFLLGHRLEMLSNLFNPNKIHPKLRSSGLAHVLSGELFSVFDSKKGSKPYDVVGSFALGGMANAWGAQLIRYNDNDLKDAGDWPIQTSDLMPFYDFFENEIGISGTNDDMSEFFGLKADLLLPVSIVPQANHLLQKYNSRKVNSNYRGLKLGRPRLAVLTSEYHGRKAYGYNQKEFYEISGSGVYNPVSTLEKLINKGKISYLGSSKLISFSENEDFVILELECIKTQTRRKIKTKHLLLGCGTLQTTRLVMLNSGKFGFKLPFIDHSPLLMPCFIPSMFGSPLSKNSYPIQLVGTIPSQKNMISFYTLGGMLWSDLIFDIPLPLNYSRSILSSIVGGILVAQIWEPTKPSNENYFFMDYVGDFKICHGKNESYDPSSLIKSLRGLNCFAFKAMASSALYTRGFHHVGTLSMRSSPNEFETHIDGRLWNSKRVRVIDGSVLPSLPAKNHSLTIMANAARIASGLNK